MAIDDNVFDSLLNNERKVLNKRNYSHLRVIQENIKNVIRDKVETNRRQTRDKVETNRRQTRDKVETQLETELETKWRQTRDKNEIEISFLSIAGNERQLILYIYFLCKKMLDRITMPLSIEHLEHACKIKKTSIKKSIQRLEKKNILIRENFKDGRGGWTRYSLSKKIYEEILHTEDSSLKNINWRQTEDKVESKPETELETRISSSSSVLNNKITTTTSCLENSNELTLSQEWENTDISFLAEIGFSKHHLKQIVNQNKISYEEVQESIYAFAFDLKQNGKGKALKTSPLNYFMGILRSGIPYAPPSNYKSPKEIAMEKLLEQKKAEKERIKKLEDEIIQHEFEDWLLTIDVSQRNEIVGEIQDAHLFNDSIKEKIKRGKLFEYFKQNIRLTAEKP